MNDPKHQPEATRKKLRSPRKVLGNMLQLIAGIVGGGSLLVWLWQVIEDSQSRRQSIYTHRGYISPSPWQRHTRSHQCQPEHWFIKSDYRKLEMCVTPQGRYALVRHDMNRRYYALGMVAASPQELDQLGDVFGIFENGRLSCFVFLPEQGIDGFATRAAVRRYVEKQETSPAFPFTSNETADRYFLQDIEPIEGAGDELRLTDLIDDEH
jgi:hypothetical protein